MKAEGGWLVRGKVNIGKEGREGEKKERAESEE